MERFFAILSQKQILPCMFTSVPHLEKCIREYLQSYNENPRPSEGNARSIRATFSVSRSWNDYGTNDFPVTPS